MPIRQRYKIKDNRKSNEYAVLRMVDSKDRIPNNERYFITKNFRVLDLFKGLSAPIKIRSKRKK